MTKRSALMLFATLALALWGCNQLPGPDTGQRQREITLSGGIGAYTKVAGNAFESGDELGLFAAAPVNATNVLITSDGNGAFTPSRKLYWGVEQGDNDPTRFIAYYPFQADASLESPLFFAIPRNQAVDYSKGDFLYAAAESTPARGGVYLPFNHILSRLVITVSGLDGGDSIESVIVNGAVLDARIDLAAGSAVAEGNAAQAQAALIDNSFVLILAPQRAAPEIILNVSNGESVSFVPSSAMSFEQGKQIRANLVMDKAGVSGFTAEIEDWTYEDMNFGEEMPEIEIGEHVWSVFSMETGDFTDLVLSEDGTSLSARLYGYDGEGFYLVMDAAEDQLLGQVYKDYVYPSSAEDIRLIYSSDPSYAIFVDSDRDITVYFNPADMTISVEEVTPDWESLGTGKFIDGFVCGLFVGVTQEELDVEVLKATNYEGLYGLKNPYEKAAFLKEFQTIYINPAILEFVITDDNKVYFRRSSTGLSTPGYGEFFAMSAVPEAGWNMDYYGTYEPRSKYIYFTGISVTEFELAGYYSSNRNGFMRITLPGGTRNEVFGGLDDVYSKVLDQEDGVTRVQMGGVPQLDVASVYYAIYTGTQEDLPSGSIFDLISNNSELVENFARGRSFSVIETFEEPGDYTAVFAAYDSEGNALSYSAVDFNIASVDEGYFDWLGKWSLLAMDNNYYNYSIIEDTVGSSYLLEGTTFQIPLFYENGALVFYSGSILYESSSYIAYTMGMSDDAVYCEEKKPIARFIMNKDGASATVEPTEDAFYLFGIYAYVISSGNWGYFAYNDLLVLPQTAYKVSGVSGAPARQTSRQPYIPSDAIILKK